MSARSWSPGILLAILAANFVGLPGSASQEEKKDAETKVALAKKQSQFAKTALTRLVETKIVDDGDLLMCRTKFMTWTGMKGGPDKKSEAWEIFHLAVYDISKRVTANPRGTPPAIMAASLANNPDCPHGKTMCIGLVHMCCGSGKVLGACIGIWGC